MAWVKERPRVTGNFQRDVAASSEFWRGAADLLSKLLKKVPAQHGLGLNHMDRANKTRPQSDHPNQKSSITAAQCRSRRRSPHCDIQLMSEKQILGFSSAARLEQVGNEHSECVADSKHRR
jgi:hypothetical protein